MLKKSRLILIFILLGNQGISQSVSTLIGARGAGMGYASSTLRDEWSLFNNIGGLSKVNQPIAAFVYEVWPGLTGANRTAALFSTPLKFGVLGIGLFRFGDDLYNEQIISSGYSNQFGIASLGLKLNYIQYRADGLGVRRAISLNFGGIVQITPMLLVGAYIVNLNQPKLSTVDKERLPTKLIAGMSLKPGERVFLAAEIEKDVEYDPTLKAGIEYQLHKKIYLRTGFNFHPNAAFFGIGFLVKKIKIDYSLEYASILSAAHQASAVYRIEKRNKEHGK